MNSLFPALRMSIGLTSFTLSIMLAALALGLVPDPQAALLEGRKTLCETLAIQCSLAAQRGDQELISATVLAVAARNPDILSAAVRAADGNLLAETGDHEVYWGEATGSDSTASHVQVPITMEKKPWATVELRFRAGAIEGMAALLPMFRLIGFVAAASLLMGFLYLWILLRRLGGHDPIPRRVRTTLDTLAEGVLILDKDQRIALANEAFAKMVDEAPLNLQGRTITELPWLKNPRSDGATDFPWERARREGTSQMGTMVGLQTESTELRTLSVNSTPIIGNDGSYRGAFATFDDMTFIEKKNAHLRQLLQRLKQSRVEVRRQNQELKALATTDPLTGCLNRRSFFAEFDTHWSAARRYGHPLSCVMVDIDHFKKVNDRYGHGVGDQVLQQVAAVLNALARKSDMVCRYGGEEFSVLLPHITMEEACQAAERFRAGIEAGNFSSIAVTASIGVATLTAQTRDLTELLDQADQALYAAKCSGRNRVLRWDDVRDDPHLRRTVGPHVEPPVDAPYSAIPFHAVTALVSALAYRHADTAEHSRRVADLCVATASGLMPQSQCYLLEVSGLLHDIGKLGIPDAVLLKPGPLTDSEWQVIRTHDRIGAEIIASAFTESAVSAIVGNHHAWYGGNALNQELPTAQDIPLGARILAIADAFDAMVSDRVYRPKRTQAEAFAELRRCSGMQFDPELVERFIAIVQARDDSRAAPALAVAKQTALRIGLQIERLAGALDAQDIHDLGTMAGYLKAIAGEHGIAPITEAAARLERSAAANADWLELARLTSDLLELCRSTHSSYLPTGDKTPGDSDAMASGMLVASTK